MDTERRPQRPPYTRGRFFRRKPQSNPTFPERIDARKSLGFAVAAASAGAVRVSRGGCAAELREESGSVRVSGPAGILMGEEIGVLVDGGYQKFLRTPSGKRKPATADELKSLHDFEEDLREGLGRESLYNESLGTVSTYYLYDRVKDRDQGAPKRVWE